MKNSYINKYFDIVYVVNLSKRTDRKLAMLQKLSQLGIDAEFVEAVNGYEEPHYTDYKFYEELPLGRDSAHEYEIRYNKKMIRSAGAWGYLKTWEKIIEHSIKKNYIRILCLDDDVVFHRDFEEKFREAVKNIYNNWKLLYLGASQHSWNFPDALFYPNKKIKRFDPNQPYYHPLFTDGSFAVGVHCTVFRLILEQIRKMNCALDSGPLRRVMNVFPEYCFVLTPNLVIADVTDSDIGVSRNQLAHAKKMKWDISDYELDSSQDLVSVVMPAFNAEKTIEKAIQSILLQSYSNLELIVVDDCSTDNTRKIVEKIISKDGRVKLICNDVNRGCYFSRNRGVKESKGSAIAIQDSDDVSLEKRLEKQLIPLYTGEAEFTLGKIYRSRCKIEELDVFNQSEMIDLVKSRRKPNLRGQFKYRDRAILGFVTSVFSRHVFEEMGLFWEERFAADMEFIERILYSRTGKVFKTGVSNAHTYLTDCEYIPSVYKRVEDVVLVSAEMNSQNITNSYKERELESFKSKWRNALLGKEKHFYPELDKKTEKKININGARFTFLMDEKSLIDTPKEEIHISDVSKHSSTNQRLKVMERKIKLIEDKNKWLEEENQAIIDSYSWKLTKPIRHLVKFLGLMD